MESTKINETHKSIEMAQYGQNQYLYPKSFVMIIPPYLKAGDTVGIVSTARKVADSELEFAMNLLNQWGLKAKVGSSIGSSDHQFAGTDAERIRDFQTMMDDPEVDAIWCARGGYGTVRIIDALDFRHFMTRPKWIIGYSDITVLHTHLHTLGVCSLHAQMPVQIETKSEASISSLRKVLFGEKYGFTFQNHFKKRNGAVEAPLVGGNLSILYSLCGSSSMMDTAGKILFLEDLDEYLYHIDRMMMNLKRNGLLHNLAGMVVGGLTDMNDNAIPFGKTAEKIVWEYVKEFDYPVCFGVPAGHVEDNRALIMGQNLSLKITDAEVSFQF